MVLSIERASHLLFPDPDTVIGTGDVVSVVAPRRREAEVRELLMGADQPDPTASGEQL